MFRCLTDVLTPAELAELRTLLATAQFQDGTATAGPVARRVKNNLQVMGKDIGPARKIVSTALMRNEDFRIHALPLRALPPLFSRYEPGMSYGDHTDNALMGRDPPVRTDLAVTLFLTPPEEYDGGELVIGVDSDPQLIKLAAGCAVIYDATTVHRVARVMRGQRLAAVTWVQSIVRDAARREVLADLAAVLNLLRGAAPGSRENLLVAKTRANLMRMWSDV